jgi:uracil-DNA glycosylase
VDVTRPSLITVASNLAACTACSLRAGCRAPVMGQGRAGARIVIVGEAPGTEEDAKGAPFVGAAGRILDDMLARAMLARADVFITNAVACWPPPAPGAASRNGKPGPVSVRTCNAHLTQQLLAVGPRVVVALGAIAAASLLQRPPSTVKVGDLLSVPTSVADPWKHPVRPCATIEGAAMLVAYHPAYLDRVGYWQDRHSGPAYSAVATLVAAREFAAAG